MENKLENGTDWNLYENLEAFKKGEQNIYKTIINIREVFKNQDEDKRRDMLLTLEAEKERQHLILERGE